MTPEHVEVIGLFIILPICGAVVFWKLISAASKTHKPEDPYRRVSRDAGRQVAAHWMSKQQGQKD